MKHHIKIILFLTILFSPEISGAGDFHIHGFPVAGYTPDTSMILGFSGLGLFYPEKAGPGRRPSHIMAFGSYTLNNQYTLKLQNRLFLDGGKWLLEGEAGFEKYPEKFWGIGEKTRCRDESGIEYSSFLIKQKILRRAGENLFTGPLLQWSRSYNINFSDSSGNPLPEPAIEGAGGHANTGIGWGLVYDSRKSSLSPACGTYIEARAVAYPYILNASHKYNEFSFDLRKYFSLSSKVGDLLALQLISRNSWGRVPLLRMQELGGRNIMRGYYQGRYRDKNYIALQSEMRFGIYGKIGGAVFIAGGRVAENFKELFNSDFRYSGGAGLRYMIIPGNEGSLRFDYGLSPLSSGFYITFGEAF